MCERCDKAYEKAIEFERAACEMAAKYVTERGVEVRAEKLLERVGQRALLKAEVEYHGFTQYEDADFIW